MYEQASPGRRIGPALIAVLVLLAGAAGTMGYLVTGQIIAGQVGGTGIAGPTSPGVGPSTTGSGATNPGATDPGTTPPVTEDPTDPDTFCPAITEKAVVDAGLAGELQLLRYVEGNRAGAAGAEAWICRNKDGVLIYQGHRKSGPFNAASSNDTILLALGILGKVETEGADGFVATNPKDPANPDDPTHTQYHIGPDTFVLLEKPSDRKTVYDVIRTVGPTG